MDGDPQTLRALIRRKLLTHDLPRTGAATAFGSLANGQTCDACEAVIPIGRFVARVDHGGKVLQFHVLCFVLWNAERR